MKNKAGCDNLRQRFEKSGNAVGVAYVQEFSIFYKSSF